MPQIHRRAAIRHKKQNARPIQKIIKLHRSQHPQPTQTKLFPMPHAFNNKLDAKIWQLMLELPTNLYNQ